jgi:signal transduction histidine kinase
MSIALPRTEWPQALPIDVEARSRVERVLSTARILFALVTLAAIYMAPSEFSSSVSVAYELLVAYVSFSALIALIARLRPAHLLGSGLPIHVIDVLFAAAIAFLTRDSNNPFFVFFLFALVAAPLRGGLKTTIATGGAAVILFLVPAEFVPRAGNAAHAADITRNIMRTGYLVILTLMLAFVAAQVRTLRAESQAVSQVLAEVCGAASFTEALRVFVEECLHRVGSTRALLIAENRSTEQLYLWRATGGGERRTALVLEDLATADRETYLAKPARNMVVWSVRRLKGGGLSARGIGATTLDAWIRSDGAFMQAALEQHAASSALCADLMPGPDWRVRFVLLDPENAGLDDCFFVRNFTREVGPALYNGYAIRRVRSRVAAAERVRLARELHDGLLQSLIGLELEIETLRRGRDRSPDEEGRLRQIRDQLRRDIAEVRDLMLRLRLVETTGNDVLRIIAELGGRLRRETDIDVRLVSDGSEIDCSPRDGAHLAGIVQEALTNIRKHSGARSVTISVVSTGDGGRLVIADDGRGFRFKGRLTLSQLEASSLGPRVITERARAMRAQLAIDSNPGSGARIEVEWSKVMHA